MPKSQPKKPSRPAPARTPGIVIQECPTCHGLRSSMPCSHPTRRR